MKTLLLSLAVAGASFSLIAADAKSDLSAAVKNLSEKGSYSWSAKTEMGGNAQFTPGAVNGKIDKDGFAHLSQAMNDNTVEAVMKGDKSAVKTPEGWVASTELQARGPGGGGGGGGQGGQRGGGAGMWGRMLTAAPVPAAQLQDVIAKAQEVKSEGDGVFSVVLTEAGAKELALAGRGRGMGRQGGGGGGGQTPPEPKNAKATAKVWVKDGVVAKYEIKSSATMTMRGEDRDIARTTTTEIKDVGTTKVEIPEDAKKKITS